MGDCKWNAIGNRVQYEIQHWLQINLQALGEMHVTITASESQECFFVTFMGNFHTEFCKKTPAQRWVQIISWYKNGGKKTINDLFRALEWREIDIAPSSTGDEIHRYLVIKQAK